MKKSIFFILFVIICQFSVVAEKNFIEIPKVNAIIGNDKFKAFRRSFTGVAGETEKEGLKYYTSLFISCKIQIFTIFAKKFNFFF